MRITARAAVVIRKSTVSSYPDYLVHYGVMGQKWGVRNYQNPDGTLTAEGRARYLREHGHPWRTPGTKA